MRGDSCRAVLRRCLLRAGIAILLALVSGQPPDTARAAPTLTITPAVAPCSGQVTIVGAGFAPDSRVGLVAREGGQIIEFAALTVGADGTFRADVTVPTMIPRCRAAIPPPDGTIVTIYASTPPLVDKTGASPEVLLATATFTLGSTTPGLPNTGGGGIGTGATIADAALPWSIVGWAALVLVRRAVRARRRDADLAG